MFQWEIKKNVGQFQVSFMSTINYLLHFKKWPRYKISNFIIVVCKMSNHFRYWCLHIVINKLIMKKKILCPINAKLEVLIFLIYKQFEYYFWFVYCYRSKHICGMGYRHDISISLWYKSSSIKCCSVWWTQTTTEREHCCWLSRWKRLSVMIYDDWHMEIY